MVYSPVGSSGLFLILGGMTSNFLFLSFSTFHASFLWRADRTIFAKLNYTYTYIYGIVSII